MNPSLNKCPGALSVSLSDILSVLSPTVRGQPIQSQVGKSQNIMQENLRSSNHLPSTDKGDVRVRCESVDWGRRLS